MENMTTSLHKQIINKSPIEYVVVSPDYTVATCNIPSFFSGRQSIANGQYVGQILPQELFHQYSLLAVIDECIKNKKDYLLENIRCHSQIQNREKNYDITVNSVFDEDKILAAIYFLDNAKYQEH